MTLNNKTYNAKILLFGEYGILFGYQAISIPYNRYCGSLVVERSSHSLTDDLFRYVVDLKLNAEWDVKKAEYCFKQGLVFKSSIPQNAGVGSSGALVAALYDNFTEWKILNLPIVEIRNDLAKIESFFHGSSSGIDPLTALLNKALHIDNNQKITVLEDLQFPDGINLYLFNTGEKGETSKYVAPIIKALRNNPKSKEAEKYHEIFKTSDKTIISLLSGNPESFTNSLHHLSALQLKHMSQLIPNSAKKKASETNTEIKLSGSGGGGYMQLYSSVPLVDKDLELVKF